MDDAVASDSLRWRIPDGRGGTIEICDRIECLGWLRARVDGRVAIVDFDGDSVPDVARGEVSAEEGRSRVVVYRSRDGRMVPEWTLGEPGEWLGFRLATLGDIDGDGRDELVATSSVGRPPSGKTPKLRPEEPPGALLVIVEASALGPAQQRKVAAISSPDVLLEVGDIDGDGSRDVALGGPDRSGEDELVVHRGESGTIAPTPAWRYRFPATPMGFALVDDDGDGDTDLWWADTTHKPNAVLRWSAGTSGLDGRAPIQRASPSKSPDDRFGFGIIPGSFMRALQTDVLVTAHGDRRAYVYQVASTTPGRILQIGALETPAAIDLEGDGIDEMAFFNERSVDVYARGRDDAPVVHYGP